jgi:hypothetical protein
MGALSTRIQDRYDVGKAGVGELVAYYYLGSCVGPLFGGLVLSSVFLQLSFWGLVFTSVWLSFLFTVRSYLLSKYGPGRTIIVANCIVLFGAGGSTIRADIFY